MALPKSYHIKAGRSAIGNPCNIPIKIEGELADKMVRAYTTDRKGNYISWVRDDVIFSDFFTLDPGKGYLVELDEPMDLLYPTTTSFDPFDVVYQPYSWNFVCFPREQNAGNTERLDVRLAFTWDYGGWVSYDSSEPDFSDFDRYTLGRGYLIQSGALHNRPAILGGDDILPYCVAMSWACEYAGFSFLETQPEGVRYGLYTNNLK